MANRHFGNFGDVFKHLVLGELLRALRPRVYLESHAGHALYPVTPSLGRTHGIFRFRDVVARHPRLATTAYAQLLETLNGPPPALRAYPGSPRLALAVLGNDARYLFCDLDLASLADIQRAAQQVGVRGAAMMLAQRDGLTAVSDHAGGLDAATRATALALLDPYDATAPGLDRLTALDVALRLARRHLPVVLWYGYKSDAGAAAHEPAVAAAVAALAAHAPWRLQMALAPAYSRAANELGLLGCGLLLANVPAGAGQTAAALTRALEDLYAGALRATIAEPPPGAPNPLPIGPADP